MIKKTYYNGLKFKFYPIPRNDLINFWQNVFIFDKLKGGLKEYEK